MDEKESKSLLGSRKKKRGRLGKKANIRGRARGDLDSDGKESQSDLARNAAKEESRERVSRFFEVSGEVVEVVMSLAGWIVVIGGILCGLLYLAAYIYDRMNQPWWMK